MMMMIMMRCCKRLTRAAPVVLLLLLLLLVFIVVLSKKPQVPHGQPASASGPPPHVVDHAEARLADHDPGVHARPRHEARAAGCVGDRATAKACALSCKARQRIHQRSSIALGITILHAGFAGHIPEAIVTMFPNASVTRSADWNGFNATYGSDWLLQPTDPLYNTIATTFYSTLIKEFGTDHFYNMDTFNEMGASQACVQSCG